MTSLFFWHKFEQHVLKGDNLDALSRPSIAEAGQH